MKTVARVGAVVSFTFFFLPAVSLFYQANANDLLAFVLVRVARAGRDDNGLARTGGLPPASGEEARPAGQHLEPLLHRGMDVRRHPAARLDPHLDL